MCGLAGTFYFNKNKNSISKSLLRDMRDAMSHRGPDGFGIWLSKDQKTGLAHRRLSIIDLSDKAKQPMSNFNGDIHIVFNGEIYNHMEIRSELNNISQRKWNTDHSDTEVIIQAYEQWGINCVKKLRGMFSIVIWDEKKQSLWLIRDRLGIKPLYYYLDDEKLLFASEIKSILKDPTIKREIDEQSFFDYLSFLTVPAPNTLFKNIKKVKNGTFLFFDKEGKTYEKQYWDIFENKIDLTKFDEIEITKRVREELQDSIKVHKVSDVNIGIFLSGGIDSSTNAVFFAKENKLSLNTFTIGYEGNYYSYKNEVDYASRVSNYISSNHFEKYLKSDDLINFLPKMIQLQDEPIADPVCMPVYYVSKLAVDNGMKVCQVGEGADELFAGYPFWLKLLSIQKFVNLFVPNIIIRLVLKILRKLNLDLNWKYEYLYRCSKGLPVFWGGAEAFTHRQKIFLLSPRMKEIYKNKTSWDSILPFWNRYKKASNKYDYLDWMSYLDLNFRLPELLLMRVDKMSMGTSLETRVPFLDHKFVEYAMSIPSNLKIKNSNPKNILKNAVRGFIPDEIIDRPKQGFAAPINEWMHGELGKITREKLKNFCFETDLLEWKSIKKYLKSNKENIWPLINVALWWEFYLKE